MTRSVILSQICLGLALASLTPCAPAAARFTEDFGAVPGAAATALEKGRAAAAARDWSRAVREFRAAISQTPADPDAWSMLGFSLRQSGEPEAALAAYGRALSIDPAHRDALSYLAQAYLQLGERREAEALLPRLEAACRTAAPDPSLPCPALDDLVEALAVDAAGGPEDDAAGSW